MIYTDSLCWKITYYVVRNTEGGEEVESLLIVTQSVRLSINHALFCRRLTANKLDYRDDVAAKLIRRVKCGNS